MKNQSVLIMMTCSLLTLSIVGCGGANQTSPQSLNSSSYSSVRGVQPANLSSTELNTLKDSVNVIGGAAIGAMFSRQQESNTVLTATQTGVAAVRDIFAGSMVQSFDQTKPIDQLITASTPSTGTLSIKGVAHGQYDRASETKANVSADASLTVKILGLSSIGSRLQYSNVQSELQAAGRVTGEVHSDRRFSIELLTEVSGDLSGAFSRSGVSQSSSFRVNGFGIAITLSSQMMSDIREANMGLLGSAEREARLIEIMEEHTRCKGSVTIDSREYACGEVVQAWFRNR